MARDQTHRKNWFSLVLIFALMLAVIRSLDAAERIHTAYFSPAPGASSVIWVAKEAQSLGTIADFALRVSLRKLGLDPVKDVSLRSIGVLYDRIAALEGYQVVVQEMASTNPKATAVSVRDLIDVRFVKELEDGGFIASLYKK
jgi:hypothetical protein